MNMGAVNGGGLSLKSWLRTWRDSWERLALHCECCGQIFRRSPWRRLGRWHGVSMAEFWYCGTECFELALVDILHKENLVSSRGAAPSHRIPLGLILLARRQLTVEQLRSALQAQRNAGRGKIGEWLQRLGFATEPEITAALARQWSCPVLRRDLENSRANRSGSAIPMLLLESSQMIPVELAAATGTLLIAFGEGVDRSVLYAIEQMLGCRTEACVICPSVLRRALDTLAQRCDTNDVIFERMEDTGECARVIASYAAKLSAEKVRLARCGSHIWIRMERPSSLPVNLVLRSPVIADYRPIFLPASSASAV